MGLGKALRFDNATQIKFFYDHFTAADVCGLFNLWHLLTVVAFFSIAFLALYFSREFNEKNSRRMHWGIAIAVTLLEALKISLRLYKRQHPNDWMPLFYCSLFLFAIWFSLSKRENVRAIGFSYITMGGIMAAVFFTLYPSTSLAIFPIWHPAVAHSFLYHLLMFYFGCFALMKKLYSPTAKHALHYFLFILAASIPSVIINERVQTNCMFLNHPFGLPFLTELQQNAKPVYILVVFFAQASLMFWGNYAIYLWAQKRMEKRTSSAPANSPSSHPLPEPSNENDSADFDAN